MKKNALLPLLLAALCLSGCARSPGAAATPSPTPAPAVTLSPAPTPEPTPQPTPEPTPEPEARMLRELSMAQSGEDVTWTLTDNSLWTQRKLSPETPLSVSSPEEIAALYLVWDVPPEEYRVVCGEETIIRGEGFMHDLVRLPEGATELSLTTSADSRLCTVRAFSAGRAPDWVQDWQPPCEQADLLVFPTHADDDVLFFGALIAQCTDRGFAVQAAFLTNHWNAQPRPHQLLDGLWALGVRNYPVIGPFPDYKAETLWEARSIYDQGAVAQWQAEQIRAFRPSVIAGHDLEGEYGHGVHRLNAAALLEAVELAADTWDTPKLYLHLAKEGAITLEVDEPLSSFGDLTAFQVAERAFLCHEGQEQWFAVSRGWGSDCRAFGLVRSLVGPDTAADVMENIS